MALMGWVPWRSGAFCRLLTGPMGLLPVWISKAVCVRLLSNVLKLNHRLAAPAFFCDTLGPLLVTLFPLLPYLCPLLFYFCPPCAFPGCLLVLWDVALYLPLERLSSRITSLGANMSIIRCVHSW